MKRKLRLNRRKRLNVVTCFLFLDLFIMFTVFTTSNATYSSVAVGQTEMSVALYAFKYDGLNEITAGGAEQHLDIELGDFSPGDTKYYKFSVYNTDVNGVVSDTDLSYQLKIMATTNLQLEYELYFNQSAFDSNSVNIIDTNSVIHEIESDDWGTFFDSYAVDMKCFKFGEEKSDYFTLGVTFPSEYSESKYQNMVESIKIQLTSKQVLKSDPIVQSGICR